jgi:hypothetical protein
MILEKQKIKRKINRKKQNKEERIINRKAEKEKEKTAISETEKAEKKTLTWAAAHRGAVHNKQEIVLATLSVLPHSLYFKI